MTLEKITDAVLSLIKKYSIKKVVLFGSRADGTNHDDSDVDLIMEFNRSVSLITLAAIQCELEEMLGVGVDLIHGPVTPNDMIEIHKEVILFAA